MISVMDSFGNSPRYFGVSLGETSSALSDASNRCVISDLAGSCKEGRREIVKVLRKFPVAVFLLFWMFAALPCSPQDKQPDLRTVHGSVLDKDENPVPASVVYLSNKKTQAVQTHFADEDGKYRFSGLDPNTDYEIHAEHNDMISSTRTISSFDSRRDMELTLKLTHKKSEK